MATDPPEHPIRMASADDAADVGRLLHAFKSEFDDPAPPPPWLAARFRQLLAGGDTEAA